MATPVISEAPATASLWGRVARPVFRLGISVTTVLAVVGVLAVIHVQHDHVLSAALNLFLVLVLIAAIRWGTRYAVFVSLLCTLGFSWSLSQYGKFHFSDARVWTLLTACLVTGVVAGQLSGRVRRSILDADQRRAEAVAAQQRFSDLVNSVEGIVWEADAQSFIFSFVSEQAQRVLGYPAEQWLREPAFWKDHLHPEDRDQAVQFRKEANAKRTLDFEYRMIAADGRLVWLRDIVTVVVESGRASRLRGVMVDITERKQAEQARKELEEQWRAAFESNPTMYFVVDTAGKIVLVNTFGAEQLGYSVSELVGLPVLNVFYEADRDSIQEHAKACFEQPGRMMTWEARKIRKDGEMIWVRETANSVVLKKRPVLLVACENITEQKRAEDAARRSAKELRDVIDAVPVNIWSALPDGSIDFINHRTLETTGLSKDRALGWGWGSVVHSDDLPGFIDNWGAALASGKPLETELRVLHPDRIYQWYLVRGVPLRDESGKIVKWYGSSINIEDRKRAEALLAGEKRILEMVAKGDSLAQILDTLCRLVEEQASGVLTSVLLLDGNRLRHGGAPSLPEVYTEAIDGLVIGPSVGSCGTAAFRGEQVIVQDIATDPLWANYRAAALPHSLHACWSTPIFSADGKVIATFAMYYREPRSPSTQEQEIIEQITHLAGVAIERKQTQEALRRSEAYLAEAQRLTHTGSWAWDPVGEKSVYWSEEMFRIFAFDPEDGLPPAAKFWERIHPQDRQSLYEVSQNAVLTKTEYAHDHRLVLPDGTVKNIHAIGHPLLGAGEVLEFVGTSIDVTERKRAEAEREKLRQIEADLARINRVRMMGELTASLAHEIKQPIAAAVSNAEACLQWLARAQPDLAEVREAATETVKEARRAAEIITHVRSVFKKEEIARAVLNVNDVISETVSLVKEEADRRSIALRTELDLEIPKISADRVQLQQVLINLMLNGIEAMNENHNAKSELIIRSQRDDGRAVISVSDAGMGLPAGGGDKIFDAFFTTKPQGTGMGLAISRSIIESHGGRLWAKANSGQGATFYFSLPNEAAEAA